MDDSPHGLALLLSSKPKQAADPNDGSKYGDEPEPPPGLESAVREFFSHGLAGDFHAAAKCAMTISTLAEPGDDGTDSDS
jgi:hypothetical protein